jgi:hypothetical protein
LDVPIGHHGEEQKKRSFSFSHKFFPVFFTKHNTLASFVCAWLHPIILSSRNLPTMIAPRPPLTFRPHRPPSTDPVRSTVHDITKEMSPQSIMMSIQIGNPSFESRVSYESIFISSSPEHRIPPPFRLQPRQYFKKDDGMRFNEQQGTNPSIERRMLFLDDGDANQRHSLLLLEPLPGRVLLPDI